MKMTKKQLRDLEDRLYIAGHTKQSFAQAAGICYQQMLNIFAGKNRPSIESTERMAEVLGMDPRNLRMYFCKETA